MKANDHTLRWLNAAVSETRHRANAILHRFDGFDGTAEKLCDRARRVLALLDQLD
jgi:hypothetical protein